MLAVDENKNVNMHSLELYDVDGDDQMLTGTYERILTRKVDISRQNIFICNKLFYSECRCGGLYFIEVLDILEPVIYLKYFFTLI